VRGSWSSWSHQIIGEASGLRGTDKSGHSSSMIGKVFATLDEENSVDYLSEDIEASMEFVDVYFAHSDDDQHKICISEQSREAIIWWLMLILKCYKFSPITIECATRFTN